MVATITTSASTAGGYISVTLAGAGPNTQHTITRTDVAGNTVILIRSGDVVTTTGAGGWFGVDYEAPLDRSVTYAAKIGAAVVATSPSTTLYSNGLPWLGHPNRPTLNFRPTVREFKLGTMAARSVVHPVINRRFPVSQALRRNTYTGELEILALNASDLAKIEALVEDGSVLLYRAPSTWVGQGNRYLHVGDVEVTNLVRVATNGRFYVRLPWTEVDRPALLAQAGLGFAWADVKTVYGDWNQVRSYNPTWTDVVNGVP